jgi:predicted HicB family RNase H-like nuclease
MKGLTNYKNEFKRKNYDQILIIVPKGQKEEWKEEAKRRQLSLNQLVIEAVKNYIKT